MSRAVSQSTEPRTGILFTQHPGRSAFPELRPEGVLRSSANSRRYGYSTLPRPGAALKGSVRPFRFPRRLRLCCAVARRKYAEVANPLWNPPSKVAAGLLSRGADPGPPSLPFRHLYERVGTSTNGARRPEEEEAFRDSPQKAPGFSFLEGARRRGALRGSWHAERSSGSASRRDTASSPRTRGARTSSSTTPP